MICAGLNLISESRTDIFWSTVFYIVDNHQTVTVVIKNVEAISTSI